MEAEKPKVLNFKAVSKGIGIVSSNRPQRRSVSGVAASGAGVHSSNAHVGASPSSDSRFARTQRGKLRTLGRRLTTAFAKPLRVLSRHPLMRGGLHRLAIFGIDLAVVATFILLTAFSAGLLIRTVVHKEALEPGVWSLSQAWEHEPASIPSVAAFSAALVLYWIVMRLINGKTIGETLLPKKPVSHAILKQH